MERFFYAAAASIAIVSAWIGLGAGCVSSLGENDPTRVKCGAAGECLSGFVCDTATQNCVAEGSSIDGGHGGSGGSTASAGGSNTGGSNTGGSNTGGNNTGGHHTGGGHTGGSGMGGGCPDGGAACMPCDQGLTQCDGMCVDEASDPTHCGSCSKACAAPVSGAATGVPSCSASTCGVTCDAAAPNMCTPINGGAACVDTKTDPQFCGDCGTQCASGKACVNSACVSACPPGMTSCNGTCTNVASDPNNCNTCGNTCPSLLNANNKCQSSACKASCDAGFTQCVINGLTGLSACVNLQTDETHCGNCATACGAGQACVAGQCKAHILASGCWECGNGNSFPLCCPLGGKTICTTGAVCPQ